MIRRRYADYFVELAERAEPELRLAEHHRWSQRLELELNNLRAVLEWSLGEGDVTLGVRLAGALSPVLVGLWLPCRRQLLDTATAGTAGRGPCDATMPNSCSAPDKWPLHDLAVAKRLFMRALAIVP